MAQPEPSEVLDDALDAFWSSVAESLDPTCVGDMDDMDSSVIDSLHRSAEYAIQVYIDTSKPMPPDPLKIKEIYRCSEWLNEVRRAVVTFENGASVALQMRLLSTGSYEKAKVMGRSMWVTDEQVQIAKKAFA